MKNIFSNIRYEDYYILYLNALSETPYFLIYYLNFLATSIRIMNIAIWLALYCHVENLNKIKKKKKNNNIKQDVATYSHWAR